MLHTFQKVRQNQFAKNTTFVSIQTVLSDVGGNFGFNHTQCGWMKGDSFYFFVTEHLYPRWIELKSEFPVVLVIDGYSAHKSSKLFIWCKQHDVILLLLYPNSTHILQVLDIGIFAPLKTKYEELYAIWGDMNPTENFTELEFIKVLKATNDATLQPATIINGWRASGLQPFNFENVNLHQLVTNVNVNLSSEENEHFPTQAKECLSTEDSIVVPVNFVDASQINGCDETSDEILFEFDVNDQIVLDSQVDCGDSNPFEEDDADAIVITNEGQSSFSEYNTGKSNL